MNRHIKNIIAFSLTLLVTTILYSNIFAKESENTYVYEDEHIKICEYKGITLNNRVNWTDPEESKYNCYDEILNYLKEHCETEPLENNPKALEYYTNIAKEYFDEIEISYNATTPFEDDYFTYTEEDILESAETDYALDL